MADYKNKIKALAERNRLATTDEERVAVAAEMNALRSEDEQAFTEALEGLIKTTAEDVQEMRMAERLGEITDMVSMAYIAKTYFKKSRSWLAHKLNGNVVINYVGTTIGSHTGPGTVALFYESDGHVV